MDKNSIGIDKVQTGRYLYHMKIKNKREVIIEFGLNIVYD